MGTAPGFTASYSTGSGSLPVTPSVPTVGTPPAVMTPPFSSGGVCTRSTTLTASSGTLSDGPGIYSNDLTCSWLISTGSQVTLSYSNFNTETGYDFVKVYQGVSSVDAALASPLTGLLSTATGSNPLTTVTGSSPMLVVFTSDSSV